jgi:protein kinase-like protein
MQPRTLGRYEILGELGRGAMGRVLLAYDPQIDRKVAIKVVQGLVPLDDAARARFLGEARSAGRLLHPGIVTLFDAGETERTPYLAMEYVQGDSLDRFCAPDALLPVPVVVELVARAAEALGYAHRSGVVHRDIKPANLMRVDDSIVKIMDFGLAGGAEAGLGSEGGLLGSPSYLAPEQIRGGAVDGRGDLFSLAVVLYELLLGEKPFPGDSVSSVVYRIVNEAPREPKADHPRITPDLRAFLRTALAKSPDERFSDGEAFAQALRRAAHAVKPLPARVPAHAPLPVAELPAAPRPMRTSSAGRPVRIAIVLVALVASLGFVFRDRLRQAMPAPEPKMLEARVRTEPAEATLLLDGKPLDRGGGGTVRFGAAGPFGLLRAEHSCRSEEHRLDPADAAGEVALVLEPTELTYAMSDPGIKAKVELNGASIGQTPLELPLDLCRANRIAVTAEGYRDAILDVPLGATPLEARKLLAALVLEPIPKGVLVLPQTSIQVRVLVDDRPVARGVRRLDLTEGPHRVQMTNDELWVDVSTTVDVVAGTEVAADLDLPALSTLVVLAYPPNCTVDVRRPGGDWKYLDEVPLRRQIAAGTYEVRVTLKPTGESKTREVRLAAGASPEIRISFRS